MSTYKINILTCKKVMFVFFYEKSRILISCIYSKKISNAAVFYCLIPQPKRKKKVYHLFYLSYLLNIFRLTFEINVVKKTREEYNV